MTDAELQALAERATPGPWDVDDSGEPGADGVMVNCNEPDRECIVADCNTDSGCEQCNADFIAAASPDIVLALIRRAQEAEAHAEKLARHLMEVTAELDETP